jgi:hypothetical protein
MSDATLTQSNETGLLCLVSAALILLRFSTFYPFDFDTDSSKTASDVRATLFRTIVLGVGDTD